MRPVSRDIGNNVLDTSDLQCTSKLTVDGHYWVLMQPLSAQVYNFLVNLINIPEHIATVCRLRGKRASVFFTIGFKLCNAAIKWTDQVCRRLDKRKKNASLSYFPGYLPVCACPVPR
ncbi:uncharacterized protein LOC105913575 [Setaria italica]|uniref:uncharacterized protein LOC105913575 n=1 Tax=Setaria italica TaxID=4555 RepID=UPI0006479E9E|nr:uncharacterized protein LOC105913575 [Setaria italica]